MTIVPPPHQQTSLLFIAICFDVPHHKQVLCITTKLGAMGVSSRHIKASYVLTMSLRNTVWLCGDAQGCSSVLSWLCSAPCGCLMTERYTSLTAGPSPPNVKHCYLLLVGSSTGRRRRGTAGRRGTYDGQSATVWSTQLCPPLLVLWLACLGWEEALSRYGADPNPTRCMWLACLGWMKASSRYGTNCC